jgi:hypothetical protein
MNEQRSQKNPVTAPAQFKSKMVVALMREDKTLN